MGQQPTFSSNNLAPTINQKNWPKTMDALQDHFGCVLGELRAWGDQGTIGLRHLRRGWLQCHLKPVT
jgi:hypothetical protein